MTRALAILGAFLAVAVLWAPSADAQRRRGNTALLQKKVEALQKQLTELSRAAVQVPTLSKTAQELEVRLGELERRLAVLSRSQKGIPDAVKIIDELTAKVVQLEHKMVGLRTELASLGQSVATMPPRPEPRGGGRVEFDNGFGWQTGDGRYGIGLSAFMHGRYHLRLNEDFDDAEVSTFEIRRARLNVRGHATSEKLRYHLQLELTDDVPLLDYVADYQLHRYVSVRFGQYKTPYTRSFLTDSPQLAFAERPLIIDAYRYDRDVQVGVHGVVAEGRVGYYAGVGNGAGRNRLNDNIDAAVVARVDGVVLGKRFARQFGDLVHTRSPSLMVGAGVAHDLVSVPDAIGPVNVGNVDVDGNGERDNVRVISASFDAVFRMRGVEAAFEGVLRNESWGTIIEGNSELAAALGGVDSSFTYLGFYGQVTYALPHKLLVGGRVSYGELPFLGLSGLPSNLPPTTEVSQFDALVQLYSGRGLRTLGLTYSFFNYRDPNGPDPAADKAHRVLLEAQLSL